MVPRKEKGHVVTWLLSGAFVVLLLVGASIYLYYASPFARLNRSLAEQLSLFIRVAKLERGLSPTAYVEKGRAILADYQGRPDQLRTAEAHFFKAMLRNAKFVPAYEGMAQASLAKGYISGRRYRPEAMRDAEYWMAQGAASEKDHPTLLHARGYLEYVKGRREEAIRIQEELVKRDPSQRRYWQGLGLYYTETYRVRKGEAAFAEALNRAGSEAETARVYSLMGDAFRHVHLTEKAEAAYLKSLGLTADRPWVWNNLSLAQRELKKCDEAERSAEKALTLMPFGAAYRSLLNAKICSGKVAEAETLLDYASATSYVSFGDFYFVRGDYQKAKTYYERAAQEDPESARVAAALGELKLREGKVDEAAEAVEAVLRKRPTSGPALAQMARIHLGRGNTRPALEFAEKALEASFTEETTEGLRRAFKDDRSFNEMLRKTEGRVQGLFRYFEDKNDFQYLRRDYTTTKSIIAMVGPQQKDAQAAPYLRRYAAESPFEELRRAATGALAAIGDGAAGAGRSPGGKNPS